MQIDDHHRRHTIDRNSLVFHPKRDLIGLEDGADAVEERQGNKHVGPRFVWANSNWLVGYCVSHRFFLPIDLLDAFSILPGG